MQDSATKKGELDPLAKAVNFVVLPMDSRFTSLANVCSDFFGGVLHANSLSQRTRDYERLQVAAELYASTIAGRDREIATLRSMLKLPADPDQKVSADIIGYLPQQNTITINKGALDEINVGSPVLTPKGLLGRVQATDKHTSTILLLSSPQLRIGAMVQRYPSPAGLLKGIGATTYIFDLADSQADVKVDDLIVTSGFDQIKRNIPIGVVIQVQDNPEFGVKQARVFPSVNLSQAREVFVLK